MEANVIEKEITVTGDVLEAEVPVESGGMSKGDTGASAYEIAVANGFEGTEEEWLESLHGKDGEDGRTPVKGTDYFTEADKQEIVDDVLSQGGGAGGLGEFTELFKVTITEEVLHIETGIDLSAYNEIYAICYTPATNADKTTHFSWFFTGAEFKLTNALHNTQNRLQIAHGKKVTDDQWAIETNMGYTQRSKITDLNFKPGATYADTVTMCAATNNITPTNGWVHGGLNPNFKFGAYTYGGINLPVGTEAIVWGR